MYAYDAWKIFYGRLKSLSLPKDPHKMTEYSEAWQSFRDLCDFLAKTLILDGCKKFSCLVCIRSDYVKHSPRSGKCSAFWIEALRPTKHFLVKEKWCPVIVTFASLPMTALLFWWSYFVCLVHIENCFDKFCLSFSKRRKDAPHHHGVLRRVGSVFAFTKT